jgi:hypothetical protein
LNIWSTSETYDCAMMSDRKPVPASRVRTQPTHPSMAVIPDVREDEEQSVKMQEMINLLVAGGYFRARIKGLNNFDKVFISLSFVCSLHHFNSSFVSITRWWEA